MLAAYTHSSARTNEVIDFGPDNPLFGNQIGGALPWDVPNQITSWGYLPLPSFWRFKKFDFAYSMIWRTGFPFIAVNQFQELAAGPDAHRFPYFFTLNHAIERKFGFRGYLWALRVGLDNVTNSPNPIFVNNVVDSPEFGTFGGFSRRTLNGRIRLLGRR